jgi:Putative peptidoglycan binding domain
MRALHLTTPHMKGNDVWSLQTALRRRGFLHGSVDGNFGPESAQAVYRAKLRLGYPFPDHTGGELLLKYLQGHKQPGPMMKLLANKRAAQARRQVKKINRHPGQGQGKTKLTHAQLIVQHALTQLGETEHPKNSNKSKFSRWYGIIGAWCAMFVTWTHVTGGFSLKTFIKGHRAAYVPFIVGWAREGRYGFMLAHGPADAILACYDWQHDGVADHIGICAEETTLRRLSPAALDHAINLFGHLGAGDFWCIEGNTGIGNDSNGGITMLRKRQRSLVQAFVRVAI